jgi:hypothetical protein
MSDLLKGNYKLAQPVTDVQAAPTLEEKFEKEALKRLGGSIAFVSKRKVIWDDESDKPKDKTGG